MVDNGGYYEQPLRTPQDCHAAKVTASQSIVSEGKRLAGKRKSTATLLEKNQAEKRGRAPRKHTLFVKLISYANRFLACIYIIPVLQLAVFNARSSGHVGFATRTRFVIKRAYSASVPDRAATGLGSKHRFKIQVVRYGAGIGRDG